MANLKKFRKITQILADPKPDRLISEKYFFLPATVE